jgi:hypothetical protein
MGAFVGKLTYLSYEFFGVLMPGVITHAFIFFVWAASGPTAPVITYGWLPQLRLGELVGVVDSITTERGIGALILRLIGWYFLGHLLLWISRSRERAPTKEFGSWARVWMVLRLRTPRPTNSYEPKLQPLFDQVRQKFATPGVELEWRHFYPVAKNFLAQTVSYSLVATYQHKYTLHRSIASASALLFWALVAAAFVGCLAIWQGSPQPNWHLLGLGLIASLLLVWGFSGSYQENWLMFGNTIITECYALLNAPKTNPVPDEGGRRPNRDVFLYLPQGIEGRRWIRRI